MEKLAYWFNDDMTPVCESRFVRTLERELNAANAIIRQQQLLDEENLRLKERIKRLEDIISRASSRFFRDGSDIQVANGMLTILEEVRLK
jgi:hypothetical protein